MLWRGFLVPRPLTPLVKLEMGSIDFFGRVLRKPGRPDGVTVRSPTECLEKVRVDCLDRAVEGGNQRPLAHDPRFYPRVGCQKPSGQFPIRACLLAVQQLLGVHLQRLHSPSER
jgi:hypothetical protein